MIVGIVAIAISYGKIIERLKVEVYSDPKQIGILQNKFVFHSISHQAQLHKY